MESNLEYYEITLTAKVKRRVRATSEEEALKNVDKEDMIYDMKNNARDRVFVAKRKIF